jgi:AraC-like DNA-binding protein
MPDDMTIMSEFQKALRRNGQQGVVDLDNNFNHKFDYFIQRFENVLKDTNRTIPPNRWSYHRIGLIKKGCGEFTTGIHKFKAPQNTLVVIPARVITSSRHWSLDMEGYVVLFNSDFFLQNNLSYQHIDNKRVLSGSLQPYVHLRDDDMSKIIDVFDFLCKENEADDVNKSELIAVKILELLILSERIFDAALDFGAHQPIMDVIRKFSELVDANFMKERTVGFYAEQLHVHPNHLNSLIKKHIGFTAKESIQNRLLLEIKYLLHSTDLSIKEIANQVGFDDPNYLSYLFTQRENLSPTAYRASFI